MKTRMMIHGTFALTCALAATLKGQDIYVVNPIGGGPDGVIAEYGLDGSTINTSLISALNSPHAIASSGIAIGPAPEPPAIALAGLGAVVLLVWRWSVWRR